MDRKVLRKKRKIFFSPNIAVKTNHVMQLCGEIITVLLKVVDFWYHEMSGMSVETDFKQRSMDCRGR